MNDSSTPAPPNVPAPAELSSLDLLLGIRKNWLLIVACVAIFGAGAAFYTFGQTRIYEASAVMEFDPIAPQPLDNHVQTIVDTGAQYWNNKEYYKTQFWILRSSEIAQGVVRQLGLNNDPSFTGGRSLSVEDAAERIRANILVDMVKESRLVEVKYRDPDPRRAQRIVTALLDTYMRNSMDELTAAGNEASEWLRNQADSLKRELEDSEMALHEYKMDKNILSVSMDDQNNLLRGEMQQINAALSSARTHREAVKSRLKELQATQISDDPMNVPVRELLQNGMLESLRQAYLEATRSYDAIVARGRLENHPDAKAVIAAREATRAALYHEIENIKSALESDLKGIDTEVIGLQKLLKEAENQALDLNLLEIEYNRLLRAKDNNEKLYSLVTERSKEGDLRKALRISNMRVVQRAEAPKAPVIPNVPMNLGAGLFAGLVLGLAAAIGREQFDRTVKTPEDLERTLGLTFLGLLPSVAEADPARGDQGQRERALLDDKPELLVHRHPTSGIAEAARTIRTNILFMSPDRPYRTLLVTSAGPVEGKTTVACWTAIAMAQAGRRVVLLDCDMRRPRVHKVFGIPKDKGVTTALLQATPDIAEIAHPTEVPNLHVVPTGPLPPNPAEVLHSEAFMRMLNALRDHFDCVIVDSPPIVPVTDAAILSTIVDGTVVVVRAFKTTKELARRAARALADVGGPVVGTVLNAVDLDRHKYGYRYYYQYYSADGYAANEPSAPLK